MFTDCESSCHDKILVQYCQVNKTAYILRNIIYYIKFNAG